MLPVGYKPVRITSPTSRITRGNVLAFIICFVLLANLAEYILFIR